MVSMMREKGVAASKDGELTDLRLGLEQSRKREAVLLAHLEKLGFSAGDVESSGAISTPSSHALLSPYRLHQ